MKSTLFMMVIGLMLAGIGFAGIHCEDEKPAPPPPTITQANPRHLQYVRDNRTNLCFARYWFGIDTYGQNHSDAYSIVLVPCEALKAINSNQVEELKQ